MSRNAGPLVVLVSLLMWVGGCSQAGSIISPTPLNNAAVKSPPIPAPVPTPAPPANHVNFTPEWPPLTRAARIYVALDDWAQFFSAMHGSGVASRYVLYDDGSFALQYSSVNYPFFQYQGTYKEAEGTISFIFDMHRGTDYRASDDRASATITEENLDVHYNLTMVMSDFMDGVYVRSR